MSLARTNTFINVRLAGARVMLDTLENLVGIFAAQGMLPGILRRAAQPIRRGYQAAALAHDCTGNLAASVRIKARLYPSGNAAAVVGPRQSGRSASATGSGPLGNHAWLVEFGSHGARRPSTRDRRTYINVHKVVNRRMVIHSRLEDSEVFARRSRGYYFIMSSWREPTRQARAGRGYTHDYVHTLEPGETYGAMPAYHLMENTIRANTAASFNIVRQGIVQAIMNNLHP